MTLNVKTKPVKTLRDGLLKAAIWQNQGEGGPFYSVTFSRSYKAKDYKYRDTNSYSGSELLRLAELSKNAYAAIPALLTQDAGGS